MKFDPITGEPIEEVAAETVQANQEQPSYDYESYGYENAQQSAPNVVGKKWMIPALIGGGTVVVAIIAIVAVIVSGVFLSPSEKMARATSNTFKEAGILGDMFTSLANAGSSDKITSYVKLEATGTAVEAEYRQTKGDKQLWVNADISGYPEIEGTVTLTKKELQVYCPILGDYQFFYNYVDENDGALIDELDDEVVEAINMLLTELYTGGTENDSEALKEMQEEIKAWMEELEIEEVDKEEFEINDKDVECVGYELVLEEDNMTELVEIIADGMIGYIEEMDIEDFDVSDLEDSFEDMVESLEDMPEFTITTYVDSNMLAAIVIEADGDELEILFEGGDYRAQNIIVKANDETKLELKGEVDGDEETVELIIAYESYDWEEEEYVSEKYTVFEYEYDRKSGDFEAAILDYSGEQEFVIEGNIECNNNGLTITKGEIGNEISTVEFEFSCKKGATIEKMDGERFDIGNASQEDIEELVEDLQDELSDFIYDYGYSYEDDYYYDTEYWYDDDYYYDTEYWYDDDYYYDTEYWYDDDYYYDTEYWYDDDYYYDTEYWYDDIY